MENVMALTELVGVMLLSFTLSIGLVWLGLLGAFHLLPTSPRPLRTTAPAARPTLELRWAVVPSEGLPRTSKAGR